MSVESAGDRWRLALARGAPLEGDGVVFTGPGPPIRVPGQPRNHPLLVDGRSYWLRAKAAGQPVAQNVCVIGSGDSGLGDHQPARYGTEALRGRRRHQPRGALFPGRKLHSRGESYEENRFYSDPSEWPQLAEYHRREFLDRTDRGVFSMQAEAVINASRGFRTLAGRAAHIAAGERQVVVTIEYGPERERITYDLVVGFEAHWFRTLLGPAARARLADALDGDVLDRRIGTDLSVTGLSPPLHLPVGAALAQGPGFPN